MIFNIDFDPTTLMVSINGVHVICLRDITWDCSNDGVNHNTFEHWSVQDHGDVQRLVLFKGHVGNIIFAYCSTRDNPTFPYGASVWNRFETEYVTIPI